MAAVPTEFEHPITGCVRAIGGLLDGVADLDPMYLPTPGKAATLAELSRVSDRLCGLKLRVLASAEDVAIEDGSRSAADWLAHETHRARGPAAADARLGGALEERWHQTRTAVLAGGVNLEQARVIVAALDALPSDLDAGLLSKAEAHLVAEDHERKALEAEERTAREETRLTMHRRGDGTTDIKLRVADAIAARLQTYLEAYASPRRGHLDPTHTHTDPESGQRIPYAVLMDRAVCSLLEAIPAKKLPAHGGSATTMVVTIDCDQLVDKLGAAGLATGDHISAQRLAMGVRDGGCRAEGCEIPAAWCEAHHAMDPWTAGGKTAIEDGALLCSWHHHRAHDPSYSNERMPNGDIRYHRRCGKEDSGALSQSVVDVMPVRIAAVRSFRGCSQLESVRLACFEVGRDVDVTAAALPTRSV